MARNGKKPKQKLKRKNPTGISVDSGNVSKRTRSRSEVRDSNFQATVPKAVEPSQQLKLTDNSRTVKPKVVKRINFTSKNNNATVGIVRKVKQLNESTGKSKIITPLCTKLCDKSKTDKLRVTQLKRTLEDSEIAELNKNDGIALSIGDDLPEVDEDELDYEDDVDDTVSIPAEDDDAGDSDMIIGVTGASMDEEQIMKQNPSLRRLFNHFLNKRIKQAENNGESSKSTLLTGLTPSNKNDGKGKIIQKDRAIVKSPSDTTIYMPALNKQLKQVDINKNLNTRENERENNQSRMTDMTNRVSNFVEAVRMEQAQQEQEPDDARQEQIQMRSEVNIPGYDAAKQKSERAVIEAEKFKATIATPAGRSPMNYVQGNCGDNDRLINVIDRTQGNEFGSKHITTIVARFQ